MHLVLFAIFFFFTRKIFSNPVQVFIISRNCETTPYSEKTKIPNYHVKNWKEIRSISVGLDQLTPLGINQCFELGQFFHSRYIQAESPFRIQKINRKYSDFSFVFESTNAAKNIQSMNSITQGLFPQGENGTAPTYFSFNENAENEKFSLPNGTSVVPIVTRYDLDEIYLRPIELCQYFKNTMLPSHFKSSEWRDFDISNKNRKKQILQNLGFTQSEIYSYPTEDLVELYSLMLLLNSNKLYSVKNSTLKDLKLMADYISSSIYSRQVIGNYGGSIFSFIIRKMLSFSSLSSFKTIYDPKYYHFTTNYNTILSILSALKLSSDYNDLKAFPHEGFSIIFELHEKKSDYFVNIFVLDSVNGEIKPYELKSLGFNPTGKSGCNMNCPLREFSILIHDAIPSNYCDVCQRDPISEICIHQNLDKKVKSFWLYWIFIIIVFIVVLVVIAVFPVLCICRYVFVKEEEKKIEGKYDYMPE